MPPGAAGRHVNTVISQLTLCTSLNTRYVHGYAPRGAPVLPVVLAGLEQTEGEGPHVQPAVARLCMTVDQLLDH